MVVPCFYSYALLLGSNYANGWVLRDVYILTAVCVCSQGDLCVMDYQKNCLMLRMSSRNLWEGVSNEGNLVSSLYSSADSLFKQVIVYLSVFCVQPPSAVLCADYLLQIIFVHKKHFKQEEYKQLEYILFQKSAHYLEVCYHPRDVV